MTFIKTPTKGMRDFLPNEMKLREYVLKVMKETYENFGFEQIATPTVEHIENLTSNQGGENEKLIFKILKRGEKLEQANKDDIDSLVDSGLRYDLTVPLTRLYANNMQNLSTPFRSLQIGYSYRAERPQKGRYRELMQCDLDILGEKTNLAEIELMTAVITFLQKLEFQHFQIKINDRRILKAMIEYACLPIEKMDQILIILDKFDKIGMEGVQKELEQFEFQDSQIQKYKELLARDPKDLRKFCEGLPLESEIVENLLQIKENVLANVEAKISFDPTLVRGMGYYTGPIFEIEAEGLSSSIGGGGRYDHMIEKYTNMSVPACGFSIGFERLILLLQERGFVVPSKKEKICYILKKDATLEEKKEWILKANQKRKENTIVKIVERNKNYKFQKESLLNEGYQIIE